MPIKDLTPQRRLPRGGHIRLGEMAVSPKSGKEYPRAIDHFRADFDNKDHEAIFYQLYGDNPKRIRVCFGDNDTEKIFPQFYKCYGANGLKCKGDGEQAGRWIDGELVEVACPGPQDCDFALSNKSKDGKPGCSRLASLQVFVDGIPELVVFQINTTSRNSIININTGLDLLGKLTSGKIAGTWVWLRLCPHEVQAEGKKKTVHVMEIEIPVGLHNIGQLECAFTTPLALPEPSDAKDPYLMAPNGFDPDRDAELRDVPEAQPVHKAEVVDLVDDPDVLRALDEAELARPIRESLLNSARKNGWSQTKLLEMIFAKSSHGDGGGQRAQRASQAQTDTQPPPARRASNFQRATPPAAAAAATPAGKPANGNASGYGDTYGVERVDQSPMDDF